MDTCFNVSCTNSIYKHIHCGEYTNMYMSKLFCQQIWKRKEKFMGCKFVMAFGDENVICDSTIRGKNKNKIYDGMLH